MVPQPQSLAGDGLGRRRPEYVIEHMEEDDPTAPCQFPQWALLEYLHMLQLVGPGGKVHFTSLSQASLESLRQSLSNISIESRADFQLYTCSITTLLQRIGVTLDKVCLLDPKASLPISIRDAGLFSESSASPGFDYFLFGGILGDDPPRDRTASLRMLGFPSRHLGTVQMTTDTALGVTKRVVEDGLCLGLPETIDTEMANKDDELAKGTLKWIVHPQLEFGHGESVEMPFRYMVDETQKGPLMPQGMRELIKNDLDKSFDF